MKATGIVRKIDPLGRIVFPIELRRTLDMKENDPIEIFVDNQHIFLRKYEPACHYCGNAKNISRFKENYICRNCLNELKAL